VLKIQSGNGNPVLKIQNGNAMNPVAMNLNANVTLVAILQKRISTNVTLKNANEKFPPKKVVLKSPAKIATLKNVARKRRRRRKK